MSNARPKTLCILFKYLGDVAIAVPAMRALQRHWPERELHVLVAEDALPIVRHLPWISKAWGLPRKRGRASWRETLPILAKLRAERFDCSVDFVGNDRGALVTRVIGAQKRVGLIAELGFWGRKLCYTDPVLEERLPSCGIHESERHVHLIHQALGVSFPNSYELEVRADPALTEQAAALLLGNPVICHISTSQPKKEWPVEMWRALYERAKAAHVPFLFASGSSPREQALLDRLRNLDPMVPIIASTGTLDLYLAILSQARAFISGDTGPLHFAAGLGVPTLGLFAATNAERWAPLAGCHRHVKGAACQCSGHAHVCEQASPCIASVSVDGVWKELQAILIR